MAAHSQPSPDGRVAKEEGARRSRLLPPSMLAIALNKKYHISEQKRVGLRLSPLDTVFSSDTETSSATNVMTYGTNNLNRCPNIQGWFMVTVLFRVITSCKSTVGSELII